MKRTYREVFHLVFIITTITIIIVPWCIWIGPWYQYPLLSIDVTQYQLIKWYEYFRRNKLTGWVLVVSERETPPGIYFE